MKLDDMNDKIYKFILKKRSFKFHLVTTLLSGGIWFLLYFSMKWSYICNTRKCIYCENRIYRNTIICPFCGKSVEVTNSEDIQNRKWLEKKRGIKITSRSYSTPNPYANAVPYKEYQYAYSDRKAKSHPKDYVVFDTETTGLEPEIDKIIEISAIKYINNKKVDEFSCLVNPEMDFDPFITKLTGIKPSDLIDKPTIDQVILEFYNFIENYILVAHNAAFDIKMLACEAYRSNIPLCENKIIDTIPLVKRIIPKEKVENYKLETLKKYMGLNNKSHRALEDCETCAKLYQLYLASTQKKKIIMIDEETGEVLEEIS